MLASQVVKLLMSNELHRRFPDFQLNCWCQVNSIADFPIPARLLMSSQLHRRFPDFQVSQISRLLMSSQVHIGKRLSPSLQLEHLKWLSRVSQFSSSPLLSSFPPPPFMSPPSPQFPTTAVWSKFQINSWEIASYSRWVHTYIYNILIQTTNPTINAIQIFQCMNKSKRLLFWVLWIFCNKPFFRTEDFKRTENTCGGFRLHLFFS